MNKEHDTFGCTEFLQFMVLCFCLMSFDKPLMYGANNLQSDHFFQKSASGVLDCVNDARAFDMLSLLDWLEVYQ